MVSYLQTLLLAALNASALSFTPVKTGCGVVTSTTRSNIVALNMVATPPPPENGPKRGDADMPPEDEFLFGSDESSSSVDWDAEWKKVMKEQKQSGGPLGVGGGGTTDRPGKGYYKSDAEIAAIRTANMASRKINEAADSMPSMPSWSSLQGDWKFWIAILAIISIGTSLLTASTVPPPGSGASSYYI